MTIRRVALIYDDMARPETTGTYCRRALETLVSVEHFLPSKAERIPREGFDLYLRIDDGLKHILPAELRPSAWWAIDTHLSFSWCLRHSESYDLVFAAQKDGAAGLREYGIATATWLPLACDPSIHRKHDIPKRHDVCFIGNMVSEERAQLVRLLQRHFPDHLVDRRYFEEMARAYSASRTVFNRGIRHDVNMRVFEALGCGSLLLTNAVDDNGQDELFRDGTHLATYRDPEELLDKLGFYLDRPDVRERIAACGHAEAHEKHTYRHRMETLLRASEDFSGRSTTPVPLSPPANGESSVKSDAWYFEWDRPELLALIPETAGDVLDVGCGAGRLGSNLKARQDARVVGIELDPEAAERARDRLDRVISGNVEDELIDFEPGTFDAVVCGDILEHLREPAGVLGRIRGWLKPDGVLVASIPNVRHHSVVSSLLSGNWTYEAAGLLDEDHVHFFTRRGIESLMEESGFLIRHMGTVPGPGYADWVRQGEPGTVSVGRVSLQGLSRQEAEEMYVYQYLVTARPRTVEPTEQRPRASGERPRSSPMRFKQDFDRDFEQFDFFGPPFAFVRFGDGERAVCMRRQLEVPRDGWAYPGGHSSFAEMLMESLRHSGPDYYLGISDSCCDREARDWYLAQVCAPLERITFANIFVNANYRRFLETDLSGAVTIGCGSSDILVPENMVSEPYDFDALVDRLLAVDRPMLVAAGPASAVIIHRYWTRAERKQVIVDVGSALDERTKGRKTRPYQHPGSRTAELVCRW